MIEAIKYVFSACGYTLRLLFNDDLDVVSFEVKELMRKGYSLKEAVDILKQK